MKVPSDSYDVAIIGAGPAGMAAATRCAQLGLKTALLDAFQAPGGQVYRLSSANGGAADPDRKLGDALRRDVATSGVKVLSDHRLWMISGDYRLDALGPRGATALAAKAIIVAIGTHERIYPFAGWTTPGVIGLAAATILLKADGVLPAPNLTITGAGPLLALVAAKTLALGGKVDAVVDLSSTAEWAAGVLAGRSRPDLLARGAGWLAAVRAQGVPWYSRQSIAKVEPNGQGLSVEIAPVDGDGAPCPGGRRRTFETGAVAVGHGLVPSTEITRLLRCEHRFQPALGGWVPVLDERGQCSRPRLYVAGDAAGVSGAAAAPLSGRIAALAAAVDLGRVAEAELISERLDLQRRWRRAAAFGQAMTRLARPRPGLLAFADETTPVCRCEDVMRHEIDAAIGAGALEVNQLKSWTRAGMGPCQGRMCGEAVAELVAQRVGSREAAGLWTGRAPLRPVPMEALIGHYAYDEIGIPESAPL